MNEKDERIVKLLIEYCNRIEKYLDTYNKSKEDYMNNQLLQDACGMVIIQIGEQVNNLSEEFTKQYDKIPWSDIVGMRIVLAHNYESVIDEIVWETLIDDVPELKEYLENILINLG